MVKKKVLLIIAIIISLIAIVDGLSCSAARTDTVRYNMLRKIEDFAIIPRPRGANYFLDRHFHYEDRYGYNDENYDSTPSDNPDSESSENSKEQPNPQEPSKKPKVINKADLLLNTARQAEVQENYSLALETYREAYQSNAAANDTITANSMLDRVDVLNSNATQKPAALKLYFQARDLYDTKNSPSKLLQTILNNKDYSQLHDNALFLQAASDYKAESYSSAVEKLKQLIKQYPNSEKLAASHFMIGKAYYHEAEKNLEGKDDSFSPNEKNRISLDKAITAFDRAIKIDSNGMLTPEYYGWKAGSYWLANDQLAALAAYTKAFILEKRDIKRWLKEIEFTYSFITPQQEAQALNIVSADDRLLLSYVWYGIYHHIEQPERQTALAKAVERYLANNPDVELAPSLKIRIAQLLYNAKSFQKIIPLVDTLVDKPQVAEEALWMRGVAKAKLGKTNEAENDLRRIINDYPKSHLKRGAIEELAIILEKANRPLDALVVYLEHNYLADARYMMDIVLSVEQVQELLKRPNLPEKDEVLYALGSKYMLDLQLDKAKEAFSQIQAKPAQPKEGQAHDVGTEKERILEVINELKVLIDADKQATNNKEHAKALYEIGAYIYHKNNQNQARHAIFNNVMIQSYDSPYFADNLIAPMEGNIKEKRFDQANLLLRAEEYFKTVFTKYPKSPEAPKALFSAALCRLWLTSYHQYHIYPKHYKPDNSLVQIDYDKMPNNPKTDIKIAKGYISQLHKLYPNHPLAKENIDMDESNY